MWKWKYKIIIYVKLYSKIGKIEMNDHQWEKESETCLYTYNGHNFIVQQPKG